MLDVERLKGVRNSARGKQLTSQRKQGDATQNMPPLESVERCVDKYTGVCVQPPCPSQFASLPQKHSQHDLQDETTVPVEINAVVDSKPNGEIQEVPVPATKVDWYLGDSPLMIRGVSHCTQQEIIECYVDSMEREDARMMREVECFIQLYHDRELCDEQPKLSFDDLLETELMRSQAQHSHHENDLNHSSDGAYSEFNQSDPPHR